MYMGQRLRGQGASGRAVCASSPRSVNRRARGNRRRRRPWVAPTRRPRAGKQADRQPRGDHPWDSTGAGRAVALSAGRKRALCFPGIWRARTPRWRESAFDESGAARDSPNTRSPVLEIGSDASLGAGSFVREGRVID